jgi:hypothetical protein
MADALHPTVAEATGVVEQDRDAIDLTLDIPEGTLEPRQRYSLWAHVDHGGTAQLKGGDLITTQNVPVTPEDVDGRTLEVPLTRI